jgi:DNA-binding protein HU-beta
MTKAEFIAKVQAKASLPNRETAGKAFDAFIEIVQEALVSGDGITLVGFGAFKAVKRAARIGRNPRTGKKIKIPAKMVIRFSAGKDLKDAVNQ